MSSFISENTAVLANFTLLGREGKEMSPNRGIDVLWCSRQIELKQIWVFLVVVELCMVAP